MIKKLKLIALSLMGSASLLVPAVAMPLAAHAADIPGSLCEGAQLQVGSTCEDPDQQAAEDQVNDIITDVINIFSIVVGIVAVIMIIVGGFKYITSGGDSNGVQSAKNTIIFAIVGLIIVALAQIIVRFVLGKVSPE